MGTFAHQNNLLTSTLPTATLNLFTTQTGAINIGNASSSVNINTVTLNVKHGGNSLEMATGNNLALIDFHSNNSFTTDYDARILSVGGTATSGNANVYHYGASINMVTPNFYINNNLFRYVPPIATYIPTLNTGSCVNSSATYSITGSMMTLQITFNSLAGGTAGSGIYIRNSIRIYD